MNNDVIVTQQPPATEVTLPEEWAAKLALYAKEQQSIERAPGQLFSIKSGILQFAGQPIPGNTVDVVVVRTMHENVYYPRTFDADKITSPACYAFGLDGAVMKPHGDAAVPQNATCDGCPQNKYVDNPMKPGKQHKPCKEIRRLALMPAAGADSADAVAKATVGYLRLPVTSVKRWSTYVGDLATAKPGVPSLPTFAVITRVKLLPDPKVMQRIEFEKMRVIDDPAVLDAIMARVRLEDSRIAFPYAKPAVVEQDAAKPSGSKFSAS